MAGADQVVCPFFGVVFERLDSLIYNIEINKLGPLVKELKKLSKSFLEIKEVIDDAEEKQFNEKEVRVRVWLQELNVAAYEADDVFNGFEYQKGVQQLASERASSSNNNNNVTEQLHGEIQKLIGIFHELADECSKLELKKGNEKSWVISPDRITDPLLTEPEVHGRHKAREKLVKQLLRRDVQHPMGYSSSSQDNISVFPIEGMAGLGKTTLAKMVYNDAEVKRLFNFRCWICVSTDFDTKRIMKEIVTSLRRQATDSEKLATSEKLELLEHFHKEVGNKRFLVVLDDVWNVTQDDWNEMKAFFRAGALGSSVVVTTRLSKVASITGTVSSSRIKQLSDEESLKLFKQYAFGLEEERPAALVEIGDEIVKKCQGLPLAVKALGGLLRFKNDETEWRFVKDNAIWNFENYILPTLRLSYYHLSSKLKQCFVFCSVFPKGYKIKKEQLIQLWMANGLVHSGSQMELDGDGNVIFNELVRRSFFQDLKNDEDGDIICKMHDVTHDLACYVGNDEYFSYVENDEYFSDGARSVKHITKRTCHVSLLFESEESSDSILESTQRSDSILESTRRSDSILESTRRSKLRSDSILESTRRSSPCLRSLILFNGNHRSYEIVLSDFMLLRALDLHSCMIKVVPDCIGKMIHLRYLNLSHNSFELLPESICLLRNMQTLNLRSNPAFSSFPKDIGNMSDLIHLDIRECPITSMPIGIGQLTCLQTLPYFIVDQKSGSGLDGLQGLNNLRGELKIKGLDGVETAEEGEKANLKSKANLISLELEWAGLHSPLQREQNVIDGFQPHSNLKKLCINYYPEVRSPGWLTFLFVPNLVKISLLDCAFDDLGFLSKLPNLRVLELFDMTSLKFFEKEDASAGGFPLLEVLRLQGMYELEGWSSQSQSQSQSQAAVFPCLKSVTLRNCQKLEGGIPLAWSTVQDVQIEGSSCNGMVLGSLRDLPSLPSLQIDGFVELDNFPLGTLTNLTALQKLKIYNCSKLKTLPVALNSLATLTELEISNCPNLVSLAEERDGGLENLSSLKTIVIKRCGALKRLPELVKASHITLTIEDCPGLQ